MSVLPEIEPDGVGICTVKNALLRSPFEETWSRLEAPRHCVCAMRLAIGFRCPTGFNEKVNTTQMTMTL